MKYYTKINELHYTKEHTKDERVISMRRKLLPLLLTGVMVIGTMVGCKKVAETSEKKRDEEVITEGTQKSEVVNLTVWVDEGNISMMEGMLTSFKEYYAEQANFEIAMEIQNESELRNVLLQNVHADVDVFSFPDDQLNTLIASGVISEVPDYETIKSLNTEGSVEAASLNGRLFAYPMTADNGNFMYYNKQYFSELDVQTLDGMLQVAKEAGKKIAMDLTSGWYLYNFFGNTGMSLGLNEDGVTNYCNWNTASGDITGLDVVESLIEIIENPYFVVTSDSEFVSGSEEADSIIASVSGVWNAVAVKELWGEDYGAVKLPTFTCADQQIQLSSFTGYKLMGVNAYSDQVEWAHKLADWLTNEQNQTIRFIERNQGPSNKKAAASEEVIKVPAIQAVIDQSQYGTLQRVGNNYWQPCTDFVNTLLAGNPEEIPLQELLDTLVQKITAPIVD